MLSRGNHGKHYYGGASPIRAFGSEGMGLLPVFPIRTNHRVSANTSAQTFFVIAFCLIFCIIAHLFRFVKRFEKIFWGTDPEKSGGTLDIAPAQ